jgi:hypothetical protein
MNIDYLFSSTSNWGHEGIFSDGEAQKTRRIGVQHTCEWNGLAQRTQKMAQRTQKMIQGQENEHTNRSANNKQKRKEKA